MGDKIYMLRHKKRLSQKQLAKLVGVSQQYISQIEDGFKIPSVYTLKQIATVLNVKVDTLL